MYIKQIIIQGFKSYKDQTVIEPFSPKNNVIVGRNGSGKSNFFAAIRFVLSDAYTQMGREERQALLHEGSGSAVMSAYVELIFDNSDERFPTGKEELILRRTIGMKKDEYSIDRKNATKADVMNLLESAGFSRSNPYYIVPQGRVTTLTNMKDAERLNLLKEVAGIHVYESRRAVSIRLMGETEAKREEIDEKMKSIVERLSELEEEKDELKAYQEKDRDRRCLEYTIYAREQQEINDTLDRLEEQRADGDFETDESGRRFLEGERALTQIDEEIKANKQRMELLRLDKAQYDEERRTSAKEMARAELQINTIESSSSAAQKQKAQHDKDVQEVSKAIKEREKQLSKILPQYNQAREEEKTSKTQFDEAEATRQRLYAKQGRNAKFKSKTERDAWLRKEVDDVNTSLATRKAVTMQTTEEIKEMENEVDSLNNEIKVAQEAINNHTQRVESMSADVQKAKQSRDKLQDERKELWREEARLDSLLRNSQQEYDRVERSLSHMMDQNTSRGIAAVRRIKKQHNLSGVYGTLSELFTVHEDYKTAVEVTAGNSLFHYVVDNDDTATKVLDILNKEKAGRVTFMPLNRLRPKPINLSQQRDAVQMVSKLNFDPKYEAAFQQVFGRTIICPSLEICAQYARSHGVTAITPGGDRSDKKGALTGGYHDPRHSRLDTVKALTKWRNECDEHRQRAQEIKHELEIKDQEITRAVGELQKAEAARAQVENSYRPMQQELRNNTIELQNKQDAIEVKKRSKENAENAVKELMEQQTSYEAELSSDFKKALSQDEERQLENLSAALPDLRRKYHDLSRARTDLESQKVQFEVELRESLRPRMAQLQSLEIESSGSGNNVKLNECKKELDKISKVVARNAENLKTTENELDVANAKLGELEQSKSNKQREQEEIARSIEKHQKRAEKSTAKRAVLKEKLAETAKNIAGLGTLPEAAFSASYTRLSSDKAISRLHKVNESLKKYSHINKKAFEQYTNFTQQRNELNERYADLDKGESSIRGLIDTLDQRKDEAIERTFRQVSKEFASIFERLVPQGRGRLIIQRKNDRQQGDGSDDEEQATARDSVENYTGVGISVSFNSRHDEQQRIQQLSGGQKSLCALALVFAIQQCDPAPFYLFDEIDANLDSQYRTAVANLLREISETGQFICTTFRPEMVHVADKCYGVTYTRKTSGIHVVDKEEALEFVENQVGGA